jgi:hypothetical protein
VSTPEYQRIYTHGDIHVVEEAYQHLPHRILHRDQRWLVDPIRVVDRNHWMIRVLEIHVSGRKRVQGEIELSMSLAGLMVELNPQGQHSEIACTAYRRLVEELDFALGLEATLLAPMVLDAPALCAAPPSSHSPHAYPLQLTGAQVRDLLDVLDSAFTLDELRPLVRGHLDVTLESITKESTGRDKIYQLIEWAGRTGKMDLLLDGVLEGNPTNARLRHIIASIRA